MKTQNIIFFDNQCQLCDRFVSYVSKRDVQKKFLYAALQGQTAKKLLTKEDIHSLKSIIFFQDGKILKESSALKAIMKGLYPKYTFLFSILPFFNLFYRFIAKRRYLLFGKKDSLHYPWSEKKKNLLP